MFLISPQLAYQLALIAQRMNEEALRIDISLLLAAGDKDFDEGWPRLKIRGVSWAVRN